MKSLEGKLWDVLAVSLGISLKSFLIKSLEINFWNSLIKSLYVLLSNPLGHSLVELILPEDLKDKINENS